MVVAHPERDRRRRVVDEDPADVREPGQQVLGELAGLRIEPEQATASEGSAILKQIDPDDSNRVPWTRGKVLLRAERGGGNGRWSRRSNSSDGENGLLDSFDPLDPKVIAWWKSKVDEVYVAVPDLAGIVIKADSEGRVGPTSIGRTHADAANVIARGSLKPRTPRNVPNA